MAYVSYPTEAPWRTCQLRRARRHEAQAAAVDADLDVRVAVVFGEDEPVAVVLRSERSE